jgi:integrase
MAELDNRRTVRQAFDRWVELSLAAHRKDGGVFVQSLFARHILPAISEQPLAGLQRAQVSDILDAITAQGLRRTANLTLSTLRQFIRWCSVRDWITTDPTRGLSKASVGGNEKARERSLSPLEIVELRDKLPGAALPERVHHVLWLILATGCRVGEVSVARVEDFDLQAKVWHIPETKNGSAHTVHLSDFALVHLEHLLKMRGPSAFLLPGRAAEGAGEDRPISDKLIAKMVGNRQRSVPLKGRSKAVATLLLARGKWTPHDLRRTMATLMRQELRVSTDVVERCLNHKPQGIVGVHQVGELMAERREAFDAWGAELERLMAADAANVATLHRGERRGKVAA